jgi:hypothetical protein
MPLYVARGQCQCQPCREHEQLMNAANWHPIAGARVTAMVLLDAVEDVIAGRRGAFNLMNCFD